MAKVTNRLELIDYCMRRLGHPVIEINVDEDQVDDRIDDAFEYYQDYHFDGTERVYHSVQIALEDIDNGYVEVPDELIFVSKAFAFGKAASGYAFNDPKASPDYWSHYGGTRAQGWNDTTASGGSGATQGNAGRTADLTLTTYALHNQYHEMAQEMMGAGDLIIRFNRHTNRVYIDTDWADAGMKDGEFVMFEGLQVVDPDTYTDVWNDRWIKRYTTALIKRQWGANLIKYSGIQLPGGVTLDGDKLFGEANDEIDKLEEEMQDKYEEPPMPLMG